MGYKLQAFKGISWIGILRISTRAITFVRLAILARILTPAQFGVFGVATLVLSFLEVLTETGINVFLIQKKEDSSNYINSAWIVSIIRGCIIALALVVFAPFIANFFNSHESKNLIILIAIVPFVRGFINPSIVNIQKDIQFHKEFYLRATLFGVDAGVAIFAALITKSAESFAYGLIVSAILEVVLSFVFFKPLPKLSLEVDKVRHIISRGWWITITGIFSYTADNGDNIAVGRIMGTSSLGIYQAAYKLSTIPISEITETVNKVTFPVYSKFSDDRERLLSAFYKVTASSAFIALLLGVFIFIFAESLVRLVLGPNWLAAIPVVKVLSLYGILRTTFGNFSALFLAREKQNYVAAMTFVRVIALVLAIVPLLSVYGMVGAGYAMLISIFAEIPFILYFFRRIKRL